MVSIEVLRQLAYFQSFDTEKLESISRSAELRILAKETVLFRKGDKAESLYILVSGLLTVSLNDSKGKHLQLAISTPGSCIGEMGLSQGLPRSADVSAKVESVLIQIHRTQFDSLVREQEFFALTLLSEISKKLQDANQRLESRVGFSVKERLWLTLLKLADAGSINPAPKVTQLAAQIDASREMTSKALSQLAREKKITMESTKSWSIYDSK